MVPFAVFHQHTWRKETPPDTTLTCGGSAFGHVSEHDLSIVSGRDLVHSPHLILSVQSVWLTEVISSSWWAKNLSSTRFHHNAKACLKIITAEAIIFGVLSHIAVGKGVVPYTRRCATHLGLALSCAYSRKPHCDCSSTVLTWWYNLTSLCILFYFPSRRVVLLQTFW